MGHFPAGIVLDDVRIVCILPIGFLAFFSGLEHVLLCKHHQRISPLSGVFFVVKVTVRNPGFCSWVSFALPLEAYEAVLGHFVSPAAFLRAASFPAPFVPTGQDLGYIG